MFLFADGGGRSGDGACGDGSGSHNSSSNLFFFYFSLYSFSSSLPFFFTGKSNGSRMPTILLVNTRQILWQKGDFGLLYAEHMAYVAMPRQS
jgi:hypothetical protein